MPLAVCMQSETFRVQQFCYTGNTLIQVMLKFSSRGQRLKMPLGPDTKMYTKRRCFWCILWFFFNFFYGLDFCGSFIVFCILIFKEKCKKILSRMGCLILQVLGFWKFLVSLNSRNLRLSLLFIWFSFPLLSSHSSC